MARKINQAGIDLIKSFEGLHDGDASTPALEPKLCPAGIWTAGWGHALTNSSNGKQIKGDANKPEAMAEWRRRWPNGMTRADADILLSQDLASFERGVERLCAATVTDNQFAAMVSFAYNLGLTSLQNSTLLRLLNEGKATEAAGQFLLWDKMTDPKTGQKVAVTGLTRRRRAEQALFLTE